MSRLPIIVAHRGASHDAPENTKAAFVLAWMQGADAIEGDFRMTKDHHIVCMHDETTARTTNRNMVVARATLESLQQLDAGGWMSSQWRGQRVPTLEEVLGSLPEGKLLYVDMKAGVEMLPPMKQCLDQSPDNKDRVVLMASEPEMLKAAREMFPGFKILMLVERKRGTAKRAWSPPAAQMISAINEMKLDGLNGSAAGFIHDRDFAAELVAAGIEIHAWTVNRPGNAATLQKLGVVSITTDRPGWLKQCLIALSEG